MPTDEPYLDFAALSLDSNILRGQRYNFDGGILKQLEQFSGSPVQIIQPDVIHFEGVSHLAVEIGEALNVARSSLRTLAKYVGGDTIASFAASNLGPDVQAKNLAEQKLKGFYSRVNGQVISSATIDSGTLMQMYFSRQPPFETALDKKHEFPDAIALLALRAWAIARNKKMVLVSRDKGWHAFAAASELLHIVNDVPEALALFQPHTKVKNLVAMLQFGELLEPGSELFQAITDAIKRNAEGQELEADATSAFHFDCEDIQTEYVDHRFLFQVEDHKPKVSIVLIQNSRVVLSLTCLVSINVSASFDFSQHDSIDKDYVTLGGSIEKRTAVYQADVLIHFVGDWENIDSNLIADEVEIVGELGKYDFGEVGPDYSKEYDEQERWKYEWEQEQARRLEEDSKYPG